MIKKYLIVLFGLSLPIFAAVPTVPSGIIYTPDGAGSGTISQTNINFIGRSARFQTNYTRATGTNTITRILEDRQSEKRNLLDYGVNTGEADNALFISRAISQANTGDIIYLNKPGNYFLSSVTFNKSVSFVLGDGVQFIQNGSATNHMFNFDVPPKLIQGGIFNGNMAAQSNTATNWFACVSIAPLTTNVYPTTTIRDCVFTNYVFGGVRFYQMNGGFTVENNDFIDGKEHGGVLGLQSQGLYAAFTGLTNSNIHVKVLHNRFIQNNYASVFGKNPGGFIIAGRGDINAHPSVEIVGNYFDKIGQAFVGNFIGSIDLYEDVYNAVVKDNISVNFNYVAYKLQNGGRFICQNNTAIGAGATNSFLGFWYDPHQRNDTNDINEICIMSENIVKNVSTGIAVAGNVGLGRSCNVINNWVEGATTYGIDIGANNALVGFEGPMNVSGNTIKDSATGLEFVNFNKDATVANNIITGGTHGLFATGGVTNAFLSLYNNFFSVTNSGGYPIVAFGVGKLYVHSGIYENVAGGTAINISTNSDGVKIGELLYDSEHNFIRTGTKLLLPQNITKFVGNYSAGGPPINVAADVGTTYKDLNVGGGFWYKVNNNGSTNGWAEAGPKDFTPDVDSVTTYRWYRANRTNVSMFLDTVNDALAVGPGNTTLGYKLGISQNTNNIALLLGLGNSQTNGAAILQLFSDSASGGLRAYSDTYPANAWADKIVLGAESNAKSVAIYAGNPAQTIDFYSGDSNISAFITNKDLMVGNNVYVKPEAYSSAWATQTNVPTKKDVYAIVNTLGSGGSTNTIIFVDGGIVSAPNFKSSATTNSPVIKLAVDSLTNVVATLNSFGAPSDVTIASDAIAAPTTILTRLIPESGVSDNLSTIAAPATNGLSMVFLYKRTNEIITIKHAVGNIICANTKDIILGAYEDATIAIGIWDTVLGAWRVSSAQSQLIDITTQGSGVKVIQDATISNTGGMTQRALNAKNLLTLSSSVLGIDVGVNMQINSTNLSGLNLLNSPTVQISQSSATNYQFDVISSGGSLITNTIASDGISLPGTPTNIIKLLPETGNSDNLSYIEPPSSGTRNIIIRPVGTNAITLKHGVTNIACMNQADILLSGSGAVAYLYYDTTITNWVALSDLNTGTGGGGSAPAGTMVNSGTTTNFYGPVYSDATGTNLVQAKYGYQYNTATNTPASGTNFNFVGRTHFDQSFEVAYNGGLGGAYIANLTNITLTGGSAQFGTDVSAAAAVRTVLLDVTNKVGSYNALFTNEVTLASATGVNIGGAASMYVAISGNTTINAFDTVTPVGMIKYLRFTGTPTWTYNSTSMILPTSASISVAVGDTAIVRNEGSGNWRCLFYQRASGSALVDAGGITGTVVNSGTPLDLAVPTYSGTSGTNIIPSKVTITALTNLTAGNIISTNGVTTGDPASTNFGTFTFPYGVNFTNASTANGITNNINYLFNSNVVFALAPTPVSNGGTDLGTTALQFGNLYLKNSGAINFNNGNYTLTHSSGLLTANGAFSIGTGNAFTAGTIELGHATQNTLSASGGVLSIEGQAVFAANTKNDVLQAATFGSDAGANDTYTCSFSPAITAYVTGTRYRFLANTANTGAATININSLGAKTIKKAAGGITTDLADNDIRAGQWVELVYDGTNMQMVSLLGNAPGGSGTVTSVSWTGGIVSIATSTTTPAFTIAGTSGGIPYFNSASTWATTPALGANNLLIGGGAGAAPSSTTTGTGVLTALGNTANAAGGIETVDGTASPTNKTFDTQATGNTLKWIDYDKWVFPQLADEVGAIITTNNAASSLNGHATFSGSGATNANWVVYEWVVPDDIDTAVDLKVARFKFTTAGTSTSSATFNIGMQDIADTADQETISLANFSNWVAMATGTLTSPAAKDGFTISATTLTSWKSNLTAGHTVHIMICRDGANDANNDAMTDKFLVISYGRTQ
jgi:hypothetical protein